MTSSSSASSMGPLPRGVAKFAVRWKTVRLPTSFAMAPITCTPEEPVPTMPTRFPARSTGVCGQLLVRYSSPPNDSAPLKSSSLVALSPPAALTMNRAVTDSPVSVPTVHQPFCSSHTAEVTRVSNE